MKLKSTYTRGVVALLGLLAPAAIWGQALPEVQRDENGAAFRTGEVVVKFKPTRDVQAVENVLKKGALKVKKHVSTEAMRKRNEAGITLATTDLAVGDAVKALKDDPAVEYVQPNWVYQHQGATSDDLFAANGALWGMSDTSAFGADAADAWNAGFTGSKNVYVGVIDEGVQYDHPDLAANIWTNPTPDPALNDIHGFNAITGNGNIYDAANDDH